VEEDYFFWYGNRWSFGKAYLIIMQHPIPSAHSNGVKEILKSGLSSFFRVREVNWIRDVEFFEHCGGNATVARR